MHKKNVVPILLLFLILFISVFSTAQEPKHEKIRNKIISEFYRDSSRYEHIIDTVLKLKNGNQFVVLKNVSEAVSMAESATYDFYEVGINDTLITINKTVRALGGIGGGGYLNLNYQFVYLNSDDYVIIALNKAVHHGSYTNMTIVLNSEILLFNSVISGDYLGFTGGEDFNNLVSIEKVNGKLNSFTFKNRKAVRGKGESFLLKEKTYKIFSKDINLELNQIMHINLVMQKNSALNNK